MKYKILIVIIAFICFVNIIAKAEQQFVYTIHYVRSYRQDLIEKNVGCHQKHIAYSTYIYPTGTMDALYLMLNPYTYNSRINCNSNRNLYAKIFGTAQNYQQLLKSDPSTTASKVFQTFGRTMNRVIIDWKCSLKNDNEKSRTWLNNFVSTLNGLSADVYVKAPASLFCHVNNGMKYLLDLDKPKKFIIQMYGEEAGVYTTYEEIFEKQTDRSIQNSQEYSQQNCPKFPSYKTLVNNFQGKQFFIQKTLQKEEAGFIGLSRFKQFLEKGQSTYGKIAFLDSYPQEIIEL